MQHQSSYSDQDLAIRISRGDEAAFRELFNSVKSRLFSYLIKITKSSESAEDAVHDIMLKVWEERRKLPEIKNIQAYVF
ncbi:MAG TPA: sigma factor, partial [Chitinophagaceae bacterium]|nr:sigma factor [Chitinophagaceae bacterium]